MLRSIFGSTAYDVWENAVVAAVLNALWITTVILGSIAFGWTFSFSPAMATMVFAVVIALLATWLGPAGYLLDLLASRVETEAGSILRAVLRNTAISGVYAFGALAIVSLAGISVAASLALPPTLAVAVSLVGAWTIVVTLEWFVMAIGLTANEELTLVERARQALMVVLTRPGFSLAVLAGVLVFVVAIVILLPGASGAGLLARRAATSATDATLAEDLDRTFVRRNFKSLLFPWKG